MRAFRQAMQLALVGFDDLVPIAGLAIARFEGMWSKRIQELVAIMAAGEGVLALLHPVGHLRLWQGKSGWTRRALQPFIDHPSATRLLAAAELLGAIAWSRRLAYR